MFEQTKRFHRQPVGFGPSAGPRQGPDGLPFPGWKENASHELTGVVFETDRASLQALLPKGYEIDPDATPTIGFESMNLRNLPWLGGRGYNTMGVFANDVICKRSAEPVKASYLLVLFESFCDPIVTGREELGFPKVWAEIPDPVMEGDALVYNLSWLGYNFFRLEIPKFTARSVDEAPSMKPRTFTMPSVEGYLHHRYVPAVGEPGKADTSYAIFMPGGQGAKPNATAFHTTAGPLDECKVTITKGTFEQLPTLWNIVEKLADLKLGKVREVQSLKNQGASDCSPCRRIEF